MFKWIVVGIVTVIVFAVGSWWYERYRAQALLLEQPVYRILQQHQGELFDDLANEYLLYRRDEVSRDQFINYANGEISAVATRALAHASQESVLALVSDMVATAKSLQASGVMPVFATGSPRWPALPTLRSWSSRAPRQRTLELMGEVIRSAAETPVPLPEAEGVKEDLATVVNATYDAVRLRRADAGARR